MSDAYRTALERHGLEDVQPLYRKLLVALKSRDAAAYEEAVDRYKSDVENAGAEPLAAWVSYGAWLASRLGAGDLLAIDENGRARGAGVPPPLGEMLIHLPDERNRRGFVVTMPSDASPAQRETAALLCEPPEG